MKTQLSLLLDLVACQHHKTVHRLGVTTGGTDAFRGNRSCRAKAARGLSSLGEGAVQLAPLRHSLSAVRGPEHWGRALSTSGGLTVKS